MMLYKLLKASNRREFQANVVVIMGEDFLKEPIEALGIPVYLLGAQRGRVSYDLLFKLYGVISQIKPDLILAWTYHSNIAASVVMLFNRKPPLLWNIRHTPYDLNRHNYNNLSYLMIRYGKWLSWHPACIIYNSYTSAVRHHELGYHPQEEAIIPNGFDVKEFKPSQRAYYKLRSSLGLRSTTPIIGMVARYHPMKDHAGFLTAAARLVNVNPNVHFILVGRDVTSSNNELVELISALNLKNHVHLLGERTNVSELYAGMDIATLSSAWGDSFSNTLGEAMACGVPCVATDIGDARNIIGDSGIVVPPSNPDQLFHAWNQLLESTPEKRAEMGEKARERIASEYSLSVIADQYETLFSKFL